MSLAGRDPVHVLGGGLAGLSAAIVLARSGREVHVHELRADSGARFHGDFQALENWSSPTDFLDQMRTWGLDADALPARAFHSIDFVLPSGRIATLRTPRIAFRLVRRGAMAGTLDQALKRQAESAGVHLHYRARVPADKCHIVATGPRAATGLVCGELFETSHPDHVTVQLDDRLAPGAYTYMIVLDGVGLICTVLMRRQRDADRFLHETIASYHARYPGLDRRPIRRLGGVGGFALNPRHSAGGRLFAGEAGGLQDAFWGFGMRYAITSGVLAAHALLGREGYEQAIRRELRPYQKASLANRWLIDRIGPRGLDGLADFWLRDQERRGDGLPFISRLYRPSWLHRIVGGLAQGKLRRIADPHGGPEVRHLPIAPPQPRDEWTLSEAGVRIAREHAERLAAAP